MKPLQIIEGHINKALSATPLASTEIEALSAQRITHCNECKHDDGSSCLSPSQTCCRCGCDMQAKTRAVNAKCPVGKW